jgi:hypothetical protein
MEIPRPSLKEASFANMDVFLSFKRFNLGLPGLGDGSLSIADTK